MDLDERAVKIVEEAEALNETDLRGALAKMREALAIEPDYPNLEDEIFIREDAIAKLDAVLEFIVVLLREGKDYQACEMLQGLPDNYIIQDKSGLISGLVEKIEKVAAQIEEGRELATKEPAKALEIFEEAYKRVADYPGLAEDLAALTKGASDYDSYLWDIEQALQIKDAQKAADLLDKFKEAFPDDENVGKFKVAITNLSKELVKKKDRKINFLKITAAVLAVIGVVGAYFSFEMVMIKKADSNWQEMDRLLKERKFSQARQLAPQIKGDLGKVRLFYLDGKQELLTKVEAVMQSESVAKGAEGKVLFEGKYIPENQLAGSKAFQGYLEEGKSLVADGKCSAAIDKLEAALAVATDKKANASAEDISEIKSLINNCRLDIIKGLIAKAKALKKAGSYDDALDGINEALAMADEYAIAPGDVSIVEALSLKGEINTAKLKNMVAVAEKKSKEGRFDKAVALYGQAAAFAEANGLQDDPLSKSIPGLINKGRVEGVIASGDHYFAASKWREAGGAYEEGINLARELDVQNLPPLKRAQQNQAQAKKMALVAELRRKNGSAVKNSKAGKIKKAGTLFKQAIEMAEASKWRESGEVAAVLGELKKGLAEVEESIFVEDKKNVLLERYSAILKKDFGLAKDATLLDPKVVLMNKTPKLLEFSLSAMAYTQKGAQGQYTRYQATYVFDREIESWRLVEKINEAR